MRKSKILLAVCASLAIAAGCGASNSTGSVAQAATVSASCSRSIHTGPAGPDSVAITINRSCNTYYRAVGLWGGGSYDGYHYGTYHGSGWSSVACATSSCNAGNVLWGGYERKSDRKEWCFYLCANAPAGVIGSNAVHLTAILVGHPPAPHHGHNTLRRTSTFDQQNAWFGTYIRDPNNGGLGTDVLASNSTGTNAEDWVYQANGTCGGTVTGGCPGGAISANYNGDFFVTVKNVGQGTLCMGADGQTAFFMQMFVCDGVGGVHHNNNIYVWDQNSNCSGLTDTALISYQWQLNGNPGVAFVQDPGGVGSNIVVAGGNPNHCPQDLWKLIGS